MSNIIAKCSRKVIYTHPDNVELLKKELASSQNSDLRWHGSLFGVEVRSNPYLDKTGPTKRYILPDGRAVPAEQVVVREGQFFEWGPDDLWYLLKYGIVKPEIGPIYYIVNESPDLFNIPMPSLLWSDW